ncbi:MAG: ferritin family protein [Phycisphaerae bacterium]|nr:ferritin family protein [Phycisphaerae bacterium]
MEKFESIEQVLDFTISQEQQAHEFYKSLAAKLGNAAMKKVFENFAAEELGHKKKLEDIKKGGQMPVPDECIADLGLADIVVGGQPSGSMTYQDALIHAMKREKAAYKLYMQMAENASSAEVSNLFLWLAEQEAKHKLRFEIEYDDVMLKED